jgi:hypothetical protein
MARSLPPSYLRSQPPTPGGFEQHRPGAFMGSGTAKPLARAMQLRHIPRMN